jgi:hypothetical protein
MWPYGNVLKNMKAAEAKKARRIPIIVSVDPYRSGQRERLSLTGDVLEVIICCGVLCRN